MNDSLIEILKREGEDVIREFQKASLTGEGTPQEIADFREGYFRNFLERYFPFPHRITKGAIIDSFGNKSASVDCVICNPIHPYTLDRAGKFSVIFADGVDCAIEIKPNLQVKSELEIALNQVRTVKRLKRTKESILLFNSSKEEIEHSKTVPSIIFSLKAKADIIDTIKEIVTYYVNTQTPLEEQFDLIIINNLGIIVNQKFKKQYRIYNSDLEYGYFFEPWEELTIAAFLLYLDIIPHAIIGLDHGILSRYLKHIRFNKDFYRFPTEKFWKYN